MFSQKETQYNIGLTDPYFLGYNLSAGINLFHTTRDNSDSSSYSYKTTGGTVSLGWRYTDALRQNVHYTLKQDDIYDIDSDMTEEEIKEYEEEEYEYLIERGNKPNDIKKGFKFAKEIARA